MITLHCSSAYLQLHIMNMHLQSACIKHQCLLIETSKMFRKAMTSHIRRHKQARKRLTGNNYFKIIIIINYSYDIDSSKCTAHVYDNALYHNGPSSVVRG